MSWGKQEDWGLKEAGQVVRSGNCSNRVTFSDVVWGREREILSSVGVWQMGLCIFHAVGNLFGWLSSGAWGPRAECVLHTTAESHDVWPPCRGKLPSKEKGGTPVRKYGTRVGGRGKKNAWQLISVWQHKCDPNFQLEHETSPPRPVKHDGVMEGADSCNSPENTGRKIACLAYLPLECFHYILCLWEHVCEHVCVARWQEGFQHINITLPHKETQASDQAPAGLTSTGAPPLWRSEATLTQMEFHRKSHFFQKDKWLCLQLHYITWAGRSISATHAVCTHLKLRTRKVVIFSWRSWELHGRLERIYELDIKEDMACM